jgi:hypothetical protein
MILEMASPNDLGATSGPVGTRLALRIPGLRNIAMVNFPYKPTTGTWLIFHVY